VLLGAVGLVFVALSLVTPAWRRVVDPWVDSLERGPRLFMGHAIVWSLPTAALSLVAIAWLVRSGRFRSLSLTRDLPRALVDGAWGALAAIALAVVTAAAAHMPFGFHVNPWGIAGNVLSNAYEEAFFRALVFTAAWYATGRAFVAALISGAVFGFTHYQYPIAGRVLTGVVGAIWSAVYARTGNFVAPWLAHQLSDVVLDAVL
jgi:membrane protease YdiL (CAAX protease family)